MMNKILWLSILGLALAKPPNPIDASTSDIELQQKQRNSRSIWPFVSSATTTEEPVNYPPVLPDNNQWFVQGETPLPQGIDLSKYPVWKVHKYNGIDLRPVNLQPENTYPPEVYHTYEKGYSSGSSSPSDYNQQRYQNGYHEFISPGVQTDPRSQSHHGTYSAGYTPTYSSPPAATYSAGPVTHQTGEFQSSSFTPESHQFNIQTQQKHEVYAPPQPQPQPLQDFRTPAGPVVQETPQIPSISYGLPNVYRPGNFNYQGQNQVQQNQFYTAEEEQSQSSDGGSADLSFLDDLGGLAPYLPDPTGVEENTREEVIENSQPGFFENMFSRFRGTTEAPVVADVSVNTDERQENSGGFLSSIFGIRPEAQTQELEGSPPVFYQPEISKPAPVVPTTYYLPKTRGSYVAVKLPPNVASEFASSIVPHDDVSNIAFHQVPTVPFTEREIPHIPSPTLDSGYQYNHGYSEVRNSGFASPAINSDHQPSAVSQYQGSLPSSSNPPQFQQNHESYQQPNLQMDNFFTNQGAELNGPRAEYFHSGNNNQGSSVPVSAIQPTSGTEYYEGKQNSQESQYPGMHQTQSTAAAVPLLEDELSTSYTTTADESAGNNQNSNGNSEEFRYQNFDATNSNFQNPTNVQNTFNYNQQSFPLRQNERDNEPISAPQISEGFVPSLGYNHPTEADNQINFNGNNQENSQQITGTSSNVAFDDSRGNIGDVTTQNFDTSSGVLNHDLQPPGESKPAQPSGPVYQNLNAATQSPSDVQLPYESYNILPVKDANDFYEMYSNQNDEDSRFIQNLNALTSYGTPTSSYQLTSRVPASSNIRSITIPAPTKEEVNDGLDKNTNKDVFRSTLPEQSPTRKPGRLIRKVMKRRTLLENNHSRRSASAPERQAPTEQTDTPLIIRSEKDSIPEVRDSRQYHGAQVIDGYSKVQHKEHQLRTDTTSATKSVNPVLEVVQE